MAKFLEIMAPNLGQNNAHKQRKDYVKGEARIGRGEASSSLTHPRFPWLHVHGEEMKRGLVWA